MAMEAAVQSQAVHTTEEEDFFQDIELLQNHGINVADIKKLKTAGICTVRGIQMVPAPPAPVLTSATGDQEAAVQHQGPVRSQGGQDEGGCAQDMWSRGRFQDCPAAVY